MSKEGDSHGFVRLGRAPDLGLLHRDRSASGPGPVDWCNNGRHYDGNTNRYRLLHMTAPPPQRGCCCQLNSRPAAARKPGAHAFAVQAKAWVRPCAYPFAPDGAATVRVAAAGFGMLRKNAQTSAETNPNIASP